LLLIDPLITEQALIRAQKTDENIQVSNESLVFSYDLGPENEGSLIINLCPCCMPENNQCGIYALLKLKLGKILDKDIGQVFIANHLQAYGLEDIPIMGKFYNFLKKSYKDQVQLYTQAGHGGVLYYQDELYEPYSWKLESSNNDLIFNGKRCKTLGDLKDISCFKIRELKPKSKLV